MKKTENNMIWCTKNGKQKTRFGARINDEKHHDLVHELWVLHEEMPKKNVQVQQKSCYKLCLFPCKMAKKRIETPIWSMMDFDIFFNANPEVGANQKKCVAEPRKHLEIVICDV